MLVDLRKCGRERRVARLLQTATRSERAMNSRSYEDVAPMRFDEVMWSYRQTMTDQEWEAFKEQQIWVSRVIDRRPPWAHKDDDGYKQQKQRELDYLDQVFAHIDQIP